LACDPIPIEVSEGEAGERLDRFLSGRLGVSRARVRHLLEFGRVSIARGPTLALADKARRTSPGDLLVVVGPARAEDERPRPRPDRPLSVRAEGEGWIGVDKPSGCGVHPLHPAQEDTVLNALVARHPEIVGIGEGGLRSGVVHRLDVDTTGTLLFATDEAVWRRLRGAFSAHRVEKRYRALVRGRLEAPLRVELPLAVKRHHPAHVEVVEPGEGRLCRQRVRPRHLFETATEVEIELETGFLHQIRASLAHLGHPVLGDAEYGGEADRVVPSAGRPLLHAARLAVDEIAFEAPLPADFRAALAELGLPVAEDGGD